jgi:hypothetical protein
VIAPDNAILQVLVLVVDLLIDAEVTDLFRAGQHHSPTGLGSANLNRAGHSPQRVWWPFLSFGARLKEAQGHLELRLR